MKMEFEQEQENTQVQYGGQLELEDPEVPEAPELPTPEEEEKGQLDLFGEVLAAPGKKEKAKKTTPAKKETAPKKAAPEQKVNSAFMIYYAGNRIPVPQDEMTLEQVRTFLEGDFPELSKERTEMMLNTDKKEVVPVVKGAKKG